MTEAPIAASTATGHLPALIVSRLRLWLSHRAAVPLGILLTAVFFRLYRFDTVPPGLNSDESTNLMHMLGLMNGQFKIIFGVDAREPFLFYLSTVPLALFGPEFFSMRLVAALVGIVTIVLFYSMTLYLFRSVLIAGLASFFAAISVWHIFWSRYGLRAGLSTLFVLMALWWYWRAINRLSTRDHVLAGICTGLALYTYLSARMLPLAILALTIVAVLLNRDRLREYAKGLFVTGLTAAAIIAPLALHFLQNWQDLFSHSANLSLLDPRVNKGDLYGAFWNHLTAVAGMFLLRGDHEAYRNIPNRPVFDPVVGIFFLVGIVVLLIALLRRNSPRGDRLRAAFVGVWVILFALPSILSDDPPSFVRTLAAMPAVMILPAWGIASLFDFFRGSAFAKLAPVALGVLLVVEAGMTYRDYFVDYAPSGVAFYAFDGHIIETARWINLNAPSSQVFLAPLWALQPTMQFIARGTPMRSFDSRDTVILPARTAGKDALFVFPQEQEKKADKLGERLAALASREVLPGAFGVNYAVAYRIRGQDLPDPADPLAVLARGSGFVQPANSSRAYWQDGVELLGYTLSPEGPGGRNLTVTLFLTTSEPVNKDYTFSIKVRDAIGRTWGQEDKWSGDNSYATTAWAPGDVVIERFYPGLGACAPAGAYTVTVEAYDPRTMKVLPRAEMGDTAVALGSIIAGPTEGNRVEDLAPDQEVNLPISSELWLLGKSIPREVKPGDPFSFSLFWRGIGDGSTVQNAQIRLQDSAKRFFALAERRISLPAEPRGLCSLFDLQLPGDIAGGPATLYVDDVEISTINIER